MCLGKQYGGGHAWCLAGDVHSPWEPESQMGGERTGGREYQATVALPFAGLYGKRACGV